MSPTEAGERLLQNVGPRLDEIEAEITAVSDLGDKPAGTIRITAPLGLGRRLIASGIPDFRDRYPDIEVRLRLSDHEVDIMKEGIDVAFRLGPKFAVPVRAVFFCPDARTIVMRIISGEGAGSVVETHATPIGTDEHGAPITQITEATIAYSERSGFRVATRLAGLLRPAMRHSARQLWRDDLMYAERRYRVRSGELA